MAAALHFESHKTLGDLLPGVAAALAALPVAGLAIDSRCVRAGDIFLAYPGESADGRLFVDQAVARGAVAIVAESAPVTGGISERSDLAVPVIRIPHLREQVSVIAGRFYDLPSAAMNVVGVTGTNGKTSCTQLLAQALRILGKPCGVIGTLGNSLDAIEQNKNLGGGLTTPDPISLQAQLAQWRDLNVQYAAMEVSSHGLAQGRVSGIRFGGAVFTNLTRDHLDFHGTMAEYGAAKARLFDMPELEFAVINRDDEFGVELIKRIGQRLPVLGFSLRDDARGNDRAEIAIKSAEYHAHGVRATVKTPWGDIALRSHLLGDFNLSNLLAVIGVLGQLQIAPHDIAALLPQLDPIAGRMQRVAADTDVEVVVDYAHTPDALAHALAASRRHCRGNLWCVFGCGGDRDAGKRPLMGEVAARMADRIVLTSDNPRSENPQHILDQIARGIDTERTAGVTIESDRAAAISFAIRSARAGDMVLLAGKGHEDYQLVGSEIRPFNDVMVARAALMAREAGTAGGIE
ncbi:MAG TPA: UDP-N-acetylmuramoyl-L-alanyl-D-glutamate--2,6-diaminopimelate ligase [Spongiibacteraceae bacterium]|nr:UDP-N-acetylmuramoyl-L-alanyl-D-glutamate--2,6-diaminopimelate ligase [Spongiibacteraceae bacterium]